MERRVAPRLSQPVTYSAFDIAEDSAPDGRLILPVLAQPYGDELLAGRLTLQSHGDGLVVAYDRHRFPISTDTEQRLLASGRPNVGTDASEDATAIALAIGADVSPARAARGTALSAGMVAAGSR